MSVTSELAKHVGHRAVLTDTQRLRCVDCERSVLLPSPAGSTSTSSSTPEPPRLSEFCPSHAGQWAGNCPSCRSERLEAPACSPSDPPGRDAALRGAQLVREAFANRPRRRPVTPSDARTDDSKERA